jgi:hypothetical protein
MRRSALARAHLAILLAYCLLAILLTWPTVAHLATHLPGDGGDDPAIAWNLWWVKHALLTLRANPLVTDLLFYPLGINLAFYTLTTLNALTAMPLTLALGVVMASNVHIWFTFVAGGYGMFLLARYLLGLPWRGDGKRDASVWPAAIAGGFYAFASSQLFYISLGQFNIASSHWVPYTILFVLKSRRDLASLRWPALAALFLSMQAWAEMTYASFLLVFIALYVAYEAGANVKYQISNIKSANQQITQPSSHALRAIQAPNLPSFQPSKLPLAARNLLLLALLFALGISPLLAAMLPDMRAEGDFWVQGSGFAEAFSADLAGFLLPTVRHPLLGALVTRTGVGRFEGGQQIYKGQHIDLGLTLLALAVIGLISAPGNTSLPRRGPGRWFWAIAALFFAWLTMGPTVHVNGADTGMPGPFVILQALPFFKGNRYPSRYSVMLILSLAVLAGMGIEVIRQRVMGRRELGQEVIGRRGPGEQRRRRRNHVSFAAVCGLLSAVFLFEHLSIPLPQSDMRVPEPYRLIATDPRPATVLDIPLAWRNGFRITGPQHPGFMFGQFYQTVHARRLLQGNTSRNPEFKFQYFTQAPIINSLLALETGHELPPERWQADRAMAGEVLRFFDIRYVVVRPAEGSEPGVTPEATIPYIEQVMPVERLHSDATLTLYRANLPPPAPVVEVNPAGPLGPLYFGEGWGALADRRMDEAELGIWAQRRGVWLFAPLDGRPQQVTLRLWVPPGEGSSSGMGQRLTLRTGGWQSQPLALPPGWGEYQLALPSDATQAGLNEIIFEFERLYPVAWLPMVEGAPYAALLVQSAGEEVGDLGHIYLDGVEVSLNQRGYNLAVISPQGEVQSASFDTHLDPAASGALAAFIAAAPQGATVAVAAADEASLNLGEEAVAALHSIGAAGDLRGKFRWSHAVIGVKGSAPGSALEAMDGLRPVGVAAGPAVTEPSVAAAVAWIRFEVQE